MPNNKKKCKEMELSQLINKVLHTASGVLVESEVGDELAKRRFQTCLQCQFRDTESNKCKVCKCFLDKKSKSEINFSLKRMKYEITHCPKGFWGDEEIADLYRQGINPLYEKNFSTKLKK